VTWAALPADLNGMGLGGAIKFVSRVNVNPKGAGTYAQIEIISPIGIRRVEVG